MYSGDEFYGDEITSPIDACHCNGWGCSVCEADEVYDMSREREPADDTTTRLTTLLAAHATATWRSWAEDDYVDQVSATDAAYMAAGGNDAHYATHWRALHDAAKIAARNPVTVAYELSQRLLAATHAGRCRCSNPQHNHSDLPRLSYVDAFNSYGDDPPPVDIPDEYPNPTPGGPPPPEWRNPVTVAYQAAQRRLAAIVGWPALVD